MAGLVALAGCATTIPVQRPRPAEFNLGPVRLLAIVGMDGPNEAAETLVRTFLARSARQGVFHVGFARAGAAVDPGTEAFLRVSVLEWSYVEEPDGPGVRPVARMRFQVAAARSAEGPWSAPRESGAQVEGSSYVRATEPGPRPNQLLSEACLRAVDDFLRMVAPRPEVEEVTLEVDSDALQPGVAFAQRGDLDAARRAFEQARAATPRSAAALYDLGVVAEAQGDLARAESLYADAVAQNPSDAHRNALASVHARRSTTLP